MDDFDRLILNQVQFDCSQSAQLIGEKVGLSGAAVLKRLKKLRKDGVIRAEVALLDNKKIDQSITLIVEVSLERETRKILDAFKRRLTQSPNVQQCYYTTGEYDFVLIVIAKDIPDYQEFTNAFFFDRPEVSKFKTTIVMDAVKVGLSVPVG